MSTKETLISLVDGLLIEGVDSDTISDSLCYTLFDVKSVDMDDIAAYINSVHNDLDSVEQEEVFLDLCKVFGL